MSMMTASFIIIVRLVCFVYGLMTGVRKDVVRKMTNFFKYPNSQQLQFSTTRDLSA